MTKRILFITPQIPFPPNGGGAFCSYRALSHINVSYSTTVFMLTKPGEEDSSRELRRTLGHDRIHNLPFHRKRTPIVFLESILARKPLAVYRNYSPDASRLIEELAADADVLFINHFLMYQYVPSWFRGRVVVLSHNAEFLLWRRAAEFASLGKKLILKFEAERVMRYEREMLRGADKVLAFRNDEDAFLALGCGSDKLVEWLPFGDEASLDLPEICFSENPPVVLFIGTLSWEPNIDGIRWFLQECWPYVRSTVPNAEFWVGGICGLDEFGAELSAHQGVRYLGFVEDLESVYARSKVFVAPMRFGAGIKIKVLNALFRGLPTVCTPCGVEGLGCESGKGVWVADDPAQFAEHVAALLRNSNLCLKTARKGREHARRAFRGEQLFRGVDLAICGDE
jgi:glycosyltransferase involved in cell wall biosynthesis